MCSVKWWQRLEREIKRHTQKQYVKNSEPIVWNYCRLSNHKSLWFWISHEFKQITRYGENDNKKVPRHSLHLELIWVFLAQMSMHLLYMYMRFHRWNRSEKKKKKRKRNVHQFAIGCCLKWQFSMKPLYIASLIRAHMANLRVKHNSFQLSAVNKDSYIYVAQKLTERFSMFILFRKTKTVETGRKNWESFRPFALIFINLNRGSRSMRTRNIFKLIALSLAEINNNTHTHSERIKGKWTTAQLYGQAATTQNNHSHIKWKRDNPESIYSDSIIKVNRRKMHRNPSINCSGNYIVDIG